MDDNNVNSISDFSKLLDGELSWAVQFYQHKLSNLEDQINHFKKQNALAEAERERRQLVAYWKANPTLTPLEVGDKVMVTQEFIKIKDEIGQGWHYKLGDVWEVTGLDIDGVYIEETSNAYPSGTSIDHQLASSAHRAYLKNHESEAHDDAR